MRWSFGHNVFVLDPQALEALEARTFTGPVSFRIDASSSGGDSLFSWDSGYGTQSMGWKPVLRLAAGPLPDPQGSNDFTGMESLLERGEIWHRALGILHDFPPSGTGLGTFRRLPYALDPVPGANHTAAIEHAHNVFLQVALDLGLPGLVAYLALVGIAIWIGWRAARMPGHREAGAPPASASVEKTPGMRGEFRWLGMGILGSLVAVHVYGLTDAIALGSGHDVVFWLILALSAALWRTLPESTRSSGSAPEGPPPAGT